MKTTTERILAKMFDSKLPPGSISLSKHGELEVVISTYHALVNSLMFDKRLDQQLKRYIAKNDTKNWGWEEVAKFATHEEVWFQATVNEDNLFSEDFLAVTLRDGGDDSEEEFSGDDNIVLLSAGDYYLFIDRFRAFVGDTPGAPASVRCVNEHEWQGAYYLEPDNRGIQDRRPLQELPVFDLRARTLWLDGHQTELSTLTLAQAVAIQTGSRHVPGIITVDGGVVMCPICGAQLFAGTY